MITSIHSTLFTQQISSDSLYQQLTKAFSLTWSHLILMRLFIHMKKQRLSSLPRVSKPRNNEARTKPWSSGCQGSPSAKPEKVSCQARPRDNIPCHWKENQGWARGPGQPEGALFLPLPVPQRKPLGLYLLELSTEREGWHPSALLPTHQGEAGD